QTASSLTNQRTRAFIPLVGQSRAARAYAEARGRSRTIGQAHWSAGDEHVLIYCQVGAVGYGIAARSTDDHAIAARVRGADIVQSQAAAGLAGQCARAFKPLVAKSRAARAYAEAGGASRA